MSRTPNVLVISNTGSPISVTRAIRALFLVEQGLAYPVTNTTIGTIKYQGGVFSIPEVIQIKNCGYIKPVVIPWTKKGVLKRDNYTCVYCGDMTRSNLSIDHIIPKSRFAEVSKHKKLNYTLDSWENTVTACKKCNQYKSSKLIEEMGITIKPKPPLSDFTVQWSKIQNRELGSEKAIPSIEGNLNGSS